VSNYPQGKVGIIYYLSGTYQDQPAIKIGISSNPTERARNLRGQILAWHEGTGQTETDLHARFVDDRLGGEWFMPAPTLLAHIAEIQAGNAGSSVEDLIDALGIDPALRVIALRLPQEERDVVDALAEQHDRSRSDMIRRMLIYALQNMPEYWVPPVDALRGRR
jgi:predicted DNA-binding protein